MQLLLPGVLLKETASAAPDFTSPYLPEIKSISWSGLNFNKGDGSLDGSGRTQIDLSARIHRNSLTYIEVSFANSVVYKPTPLEADCQNSIGYSVGDWTRSVDARPLNLSSRIADGDRYTERYIVEAATNGVVRPLCPGEYSLSSVRIHDAAGRDLQIRLGGWYQANAIHQSSYFWGKMEETSSLLPCKVIGKGLNTFNPELWLELCNHSVSSKSIQFTVKASERKSLALPETVDYISKLTQLQNQTSTLNAEKSLLQSQVTSLTSDKTALQSQVTSLTSEKSTLQTQIASLTADKVNLQNQINSLTSDKSTIQVQLNNISSEKSALQNQISSLTNEKTSLQKRLAAICKSKPKPKGC